MIIRRHLLLMAAAFIDLLYSNQRFLFNNSIQLQKRNQYDSRLDHRHNDGHCDIEDDGGVE